MTPKVSIIVPVYNGKKTLPFCLDSLMSLDFPKDELEIIVVDNNSIDGTNEIIKRYPVKYVFEKKRGRATARNRGIREAKGELIAFTDADCVVDRLWLTNLIKGFTDGEIGGCGGEILSYNPQTPIEKYYDFKCIISQRESLAREDIFLPRIATSNAIYRRGVLEEVGLFDDYFITGEDVDLSWRVYLRGYQLNYIPSAIVYHKCSIISIKDFFKHFFEYGYTYSYLLEKYKISFKKPYVGWNVFFFYLLSSTKNFFKDAFTKKATLNKVFIIFDIIKKVAYVSGIIYGLMILSLRIKKISSQLKVHGRLSYGIVDGKLIITDTERECNYILNETATAIWTLLKKGKDIAEIIDIITHQYKAHSEEVRNDVISFISELESKGLYKDNHIKKTINNN